MKVLKFEFNMFGENTYLLYDPDTLDAAVVDPGMMDDHEKASFARVISERKLKLGQVILTHLHVDHIMGIDWLRNELGVKVAGSQDDEFLGKRVAEQVQMFHLPVSVGNLELDVKLHDGDTILIGNGELKVIAVPGHSPGGLALYDEADGFVITGDSLFNRSIGRTDLPGGDYKILVKSVTDKLFTLPPSTTVLPGHGPATTIGDEEKYNPYL